MEMYLLMILLLKFIENKEKDCQCSRVNVNIPDRIELLH